MQVVVETTHGLGRRMTITLAAEQIEQAVHTELQRRAKTLRINGFRPGKVPIALVRQQQGESVRQVVQHELMQRHFEQAVMQQKLQPAGRVQILPQELSDGGDFSYQVMFEIYPEITLRGLQDIVVEQPRAEISAADVEELLLRLLRRFATWHPTDSAAGLRDRVTLNFSGSINGECFEGGTANDFELILGENGLVSGFDEGITGRQAGEKFTIDVTFPAIYPNAENLQGKTAQFSIQLIQVERCLLPEWSPEIIEQFGVPDGKLESLEHTVRAAMNRELQRAIKQRVKSQISNALLERHADLTVPESLVDQALERRAQRDSERGSVHLLSDQRVPNSFLSGDQLREQARRRVAVSLLFEEVIKERALQPDSVQVDRILEEIAADYENSPEMIRYYRSNRELMKNIHLIALEERAIESLLETAIVSEKQFSFSELIQQRG